MMRQAPPGHDRAATGDNTGDAIGSQRHISQQHTSMDRHIVDALFGLLNDRIAEDLPGELLCHAIDLLQGLVDRHRTDGHGGVAHNPFASGVDIIAGGQVHDGIGAPAGSPA